MKTYQWIENDWGFSDLYFKENDVNSNNNNNNTVQRKYFLFQTNMTRDRIACFKWKKLNEMPLFPKFTRYSLCGGEFSGLTAWSRDADSRRQFLEWLLLEEVQMQCDSIVWFNFFLRRKVFPQTKKKWPVFHLTQDILTNRSSVTIFDYPVIVKNQLKERNTEATR